MAAQNRLRASIKESHDEYLSDLEEQRDATRAQVEREVMEEGLAALGYIEQPTAPHEVLLWYVRRIGIGLGFVGLAGLGIGVFGPRVASLVGFGLALGAFLLIAVAEALDEYAGDLEVAA